MLRLLTLHCATSGGHQDSCFFAHRNDYVQDTHDSQQTYCDYTESNTIVMKHCSCGGCQHGGCVAFESLLLLHIVRWCAVVIRDDSSRKQG